MTETIEWYPLPEVEEEEEVGLRGVQRAPIQHTVSHPSQVTTSKAISQKTSSPNSTPANSYSAPHMTGTVQPYLKRGQCRPQPETTMAASCSDTAVQQSTSTFPDSLDSVDLASIQQKAALLLSSSRRRKESASKPPGKAELPVTSLRAASPTSHKSPQADKTMPTLPLTTSSSPPPRLPPSTASSHHSTQGIPKLQDFSMGSIQSSPTLSESGRVAQHHQHSDTDDIPGLLPPSMWATGLQLPSSPQHTTVSLLELDRLWKEFLASSLTGQRPVGREPPQPVQSTPPPSQEVVLLPLSEQEHVAASVTPFVKKDIAIQTTPSLNVLQPTKPVAFTVAHQQKRQTFVQAQHSAQLSQLTLQEALQTLRPDFVHRSEARQRTLKRSKELRASTSRPTSAGQFTSSGKDVYITAIRKGNPRTPQFFYVNTTNNRPRMSPQEMYHSSKRHWSNLPEVKQKVREKQKRREMATNRLRMKLYQQEVLVRLRQKRK